MLKVRDLRLSLPDLNRKPLFGSPPLLDILQGVDLDLAPGEALGLVGESGSGKTTIGRCLVRLYAPTGGTIIFEDRDITHLSEAALRPLRSRFQIIFQDPQSALNPRRTVGQAILRPLRLYGRVSGREQEKAALDRLMRRVALDPALADRYPHELSGGQRQRVGIARAIGLEPAFIVADEIVSGLDVSSQAQILDLLRRLRQEMGLAIIFISHDLSVVRTLCDRVMVLTGGTVVEQGACADIFARPQHLYTRTLLSAIPLPDIDKDWLAADPETTEDPSGMTPERQFQTGGKAMQIKGATALVTGANRGIGAAFVAELKKRGAAKIYAAVRDPGSLENADGLDVVPLDVTKPDDIHKAAAACRDVNLLINNAGINFNRAVIAADDPDLARQEMDVNYLGLLAMSRAFAPVLKANGGGAMVNMLSILSRTAMPAIGSYCASKAAAYSLTQSVRAELAGQGTLVVGVMPGAVDTRINEGMDIPKEPPSLIATAGLDAVEGGVEDIYPGGMAEGLAQGLAADAKAVEKDMAQYLPQ